MRKPSPSPSDLTDEQWEVVKPLIRDMLPHDGCDL